MFKFATRWDRPGCSQDFVRIEEPIFHGIRWAKWGFGGGSALCTPLSDEQLVPSVGSYDAEASGSATLELFHSLDDDQIHGYGTLDVQVMDGELVEGDVIEVRMGLEEENAAGRPPTEPSGAD